jgi:hypothetical protein
MTKHKLLIISSFIIEQLWNNIIIWHLGLVIQKQFCDAAVAKASLFIITVAASQHFVTVTWHGNYEVLHSFISTTVVQSMLRIRDGDRAMLVQHSNLAHSQYQFLSLFMGCEPFHATFSYMYSKYTSTHVQYLNIYSSVADPDANPDPHIFGPPGSGSGSFYHQAKIVRKTFIPTALWLFFTFYLWKWCKCTF